MSAFIKVDGKRIWLELPENTEYKIVRMSDGTHIFRCKFKWGANKQFVSVVAFRVKNAVLQFSAYGHLSEVKKDSQVLNPAIWYDFPKSSDNNVHYATVSRKLGKFALKIHDFD